VRSLNSDNTDIVELLLEAGASAHFDDGINNVILGAIRKKCPKVAVHLIKCGANVNESDSTGYTPLHKAAQKGYADVVLTLIDHNADVNRPTLTDRERPIHYARTAEVTTILINAKAEVNYFSSLGETPLLRMCAEGLLQVAEVLITNGAKLNTSQSKNTPLLLAISLEDDGLRSQLVELLISRGADVNYFGNYDTPLIRAISLKRDNIVELLIAKHADPNQQDANDMNPLSMARAVGDKKRMKWLLVHGADSNKEILGKHKAPKEVKTSLSRVLLIFRLFMTYVDIITDYFTLSIYYKRGQFRLFGLALAFVAIPTVLSVSIRKGWWGRFLSLTQLSILHETIKAWRDEQETQLLTTLTALESVLEACPSALLQFFALWDTWFEADIHENGVSFIESTTDLALLGSVVLSCLATSRFLSDFLTTTQERDIVFLSGWSVLDTPIFFVLYHFCEESFRLFTLVALFLAVRAYGLLFLALSFLMRCFLVTSWFDIESFKSKDTYPAYLNHNVKVTYRIILSLATDCLWTKSNAAMQLLTIWEGIFYMILLFLTHPGERSDQMMTLLYCVLASGFCKSGLYYLTYWEIYVNKDYFESLRNSLGGRPSFTYDNVNDYNNDFQSQPGEEGAVDQGGISGKNLPSDNDTGNVTAAGNGIKARSSVELELPSLTVVSATTDVTAKL